ncbi:putative short-chain dehydrogenase [Dactylonectria estremocensis]|uniref:Short-chain dehydrogenase n=1 Tax=Dactylonectria estremocensis TaxID=1079267 RepID=A0A9P9DN32_9HYPO|nr:putative short-chain dehydrogenase [Dactylonectria estremocensis]
MALATSTVFPGFAFTKTIHHAPYPAISPLRPELSQAGRTVLITGGSTGIGFAIAKAYAQAGAERIIILGRRKELVQSAIAQLGSEYPGVHLTGRVCDVTNLAAVGELWISFEKDRVFIDVLVLNAAKVSPAEPLLALGRDTVLDDFNMNVRAHMDFAERLCKQPGDKTRAKALVNVSTQAIHDFNIAGKLPNYTLTKNAGTLLVQMIAKDVSSLDLQVVSFHPGGIFTEGAQSGGWKKDDFPWDDENLPGQFAVWAASPEARFLHGRFVWAGWDVNELQEGELRERIDQDEYFLRVGVVGIQEWEKRN